MATTSLWHIEGRLKDLIAYVENPEKTRAENPNLQPLWDVFSYVSRPEATEQGEYVSAINCLKEIALQQMILTKKQYGKENGYIAWHGYQSFKPDEVTPEQAHKIGLQTGKGNVGRSAIRSSSLPTLIKTICTIIFALIRFPFLTGRNTTIPNQSRENSARYPTGSAGNTAYRSLKIPIKRRQGRYGWMRKAASRQDTMFTGKM